MMFDTIAETARLIASKRATPNDVLEHCFKQIDRWEHQVRAWVLIDRAGAKAQADRLTAELKTSPPRSPLHGIPLGIKDIIDVANFPTTAGSGKWAQAVARDDAPLVLALRQAGAIILGKTVTTQFASFDPPVTRNPWHADRTPGGSSSGSAAAVATRMCLGALGSQTGGSITRPASYCGVAGFKPSYGLLPTDGIVPLAASMDHPGPIARCVTDLQLLTQGMTSLRWPARSSDTLGIGRLRGFFDHRADAEVNAMMDRATQKLRDAELSVVDCDAPPEFGEVVPRHRIIMAVEAAMFHEARFRADGSDYQPRIRELIEEGLACPAPEYARCQAHRRQLQAAMTQLFEHCDVLLTPATTCPAPPAATTGDPAFNSPWSYLGLPTISLPVAQSRDGLPLAIQMVGCQAGDTDLFQAALLCERALGVAPMNPAEPK